MSLRGSPAGRRRTYDPPVGEKRSNPILWVIAAIVLIMLASAGTILWVSISQDSARGYIPRDERGTQAVPPASSGSDE